MIRTVYAGDTAVSYTLIHKNVKNLNLRVHTDLTISVSVPKYVTPAEADRFVISKAQFIISALEKYSEIEKDRSRSIPDTPTCGDKIRLFGKEFTLKIISGKRISASESEDNIILSVKDINNSEEIKKALDGFVAVKCRSYITGECRRIYENIFSPYIDRFPEIRIRNMKSRWGSCQPQRYILTFNQKLVFSQPQCVEYVICHEFMHFLHPDHSKLFHSAMSRLMPDWKERKKLFNS